jgi:protease I
MVPFVREMIQLYAGGPASKEALRRRHSDPQRESPTAVTGAAMRWMPRSPLGTVLGLALIGVGVMAASRKNGGEHISATEARSASV